MNNSIINKSIGLIEKLSALHSLNKEEWIHLVSNRNALTDSLIQKQASSARDKIYGRKIFIRGLIEFTNYCKNNCLYCGLRRDNKSVIRYRLSKTDILNSCKYGYSIGCRTFVLQGGEDLFWSVAKISDLISEIKTTFPDCAITLSFGEHSRETYAQWKNAGADRYLLRHETATQSHYEFLHPNEMSFDSRIDCLNFLKQEGYAVGCGFMVGSPRQTTSCIANDLIFIQDFKPDMVGIGPFIPAENTPFQNEASGTLTDTLFLISAIRLINPSLLIPATTALGIIHPQGREMGISFGANVLMPNISPNIAKENYSIYNNKSEANDDPSNLFQTLKQNLVETGYEITISRGDKQK